MGGPSSSSASSRGSATLALKLEPALVKAVSLEAKLLKKSPQSLLRAAVKAYLEELEDARIVAQRKKEKSVPYSEARKRLGLAA